MNSSHQVDFHYDVCIVGGCGHIGLPLGLAFAAEGKKVMLYDLNTKVIETVCRGEMPFIEYDADPILKKTIGKTLFCSSDIESVGLARVLIVAIGTPVDEYLNPKLRSLLELFAKLRPHLSNQQTIVIRSTVYPRTCQQIRNQLEQDGSGPWHIAYCPERIAQGYAVRELKELPQLVAGITEKALEDVKELFSIIAPKVIPVTIEEAELAKLFTNAWRYIQFATVNQFYMISNDFGVDYEQVRRAIVDGYGRAYGMPSAGFAAGPCLLKDTMQLAAFNNNNFALGHAAMMINEGLPGYLVEQLRKKYDLKQMRVGILGMAFKADIDDIRDSLSYKLGKILRFHGAHILYSDEFAKDPTFISKEELVASSDIIFVGVPHSAYKQLCIPSSVELIDLWNIIPSNAS
ncbi:MAG TPA: nucleotide sugar dehydrogenase [Anaerolineales bacterium]|nr:nucleotide sugar dehydrogenase [Anaerolineales bacterium]